MKRGGLVAKLKVYEDVDSGPINFHIMNVLIDDCDGACVIMLLVLIVS